MPRHRKAQGRRKWTLGREEGSWRNVLPGLVLSGILAPARGARRAPRRPAGPGDGRAAARGPGRPRLGLARSLMVTPWLAASAGIVIAAALTVDSPAALIYVPDGPAVRCPANGCPGATSSPPGVTTDVPGVQLKTGTAPGAARPGAPGRHHAPYQLGYRVVRRWPWGFVAVITLPADLKPGAWSLRLGFRSARIDHIRGARWQPSGHDQAGTATGSWRPHGHAPGGQGVDGLQLTVFAVGTPTLPSDCRLDGVRCVFSG
jgi:hypothetical protein